MKYEQELLDLAPQTAIRPEPIIWNHDGTEGAAAGGDQGRRDSLGLDALAVSDRFRLFNFTRRDDHVAYLWVLRALGTDSTLKLTPNPDPDPDEDDEDDEELADPL